MISERLNSVGKQVVCICKRRKSNLKTRDLYRQPLFPHNETATFHNQTAVTYTAHAAQYHENGVTECGSGEISV